MIESIVHNLLETAMSPTKFDTARSLRSSSIALVVALAALPAAAQDELFSRHVGTTTFDSAYAAAPDGAGGVYMGEFTDGDLSGANAGMVDAWLGRYDAAGNQLWIRQFGPSSIYQAYAAVPAVQGDMTGQVLRAWGGLPVPPSTLTGAE